jgi:hypothetical protein
MAVSTKVVSRPSTEIEGFRRSRSRPFEPSGAGLPLCPDRRHHRSCSASPAAAILMTHGLTASQTAGCRLEAFLGQAQEQLTHRN